MNPRPDEQPEKKSFYNLEGGQSKSNAVEALTILPNRGGLLKGFNDKFHGNALNGTLSFLSPLSTSLTSPTKKISQTIYLGFVFYKPRFGGLFVHVARDGPRADQA
jgi:hypothetical protein